MKIPVTNIFFSCVLFLTSCTYSITMVHSSGSASDLVDENQTVTSHAQAEATIPLS